MVLVRLKGINSVTKRLADGTLRTYWYAWKGGPSLRGEPGTPEFTASYNGDNNFNTSTAASLPITNSGISGQLSLSAASPGTSSLSATHTPASLSH